MNKSLIVIGGNKEASIGLRKLYKKYEITLIDGNELCEGKKYSHNFIKANVYKYKEIIYEVKKRFLKIKKPDAVLNLASDDVLSVAYLNKFFNLNGISINSAKKTTNKILMKKCLASHDILTPNFIHVKSLNDLKKNYIKLKCKHYIIKPIIGRGSNGVLKINNESEFNSSFSESKFLSNSNHFLLEEYIQGKQLSSEAILIDGIVKFVAISDRSYDFNKFTHPYIIENGGETPSKYSKKYNLQIKKIIEKISSAFSFKNGTLKLDLVVNKGKIFVIEFALRLSGGNYSSITIPKVYGVNIIDILVKILCKEKINENTFKDKVKSYQSNRYLILPPGKIIKFNNFKTKDKDCVYNDIRLKKNQTVLKPKKHSQRLGSVIYCTSDQRISILKATNHINSIKDSCEIVKS